MSCKTSKCQETHPLMWSGTTIAARIAGVVQRLAELNFPLAVKDARALLGILDRLVDMGDRRAAALQQSEQFRGVKQGRPMRVFYSWQSDIFPKECRSFIRSALSAAVTAAADDLDVADADRPELDSDTQGAPGWSISAPPSWTRSRPPQHSSPTSRPSRRPLAARRCPIPTSC